MPDNYLTEKVFTWDYDLCQNWSSQVKGIFCSINMEQVYTTKTVCNWILWKQNVKRLMNHNG